MKKMGWLVLIVAVLLGCSLSVSAGSVPEDILHYDGAQLFFAEVVDCRSEGVDAQVELRPVKVVKGEVPLDTVLTYEEAIGVGDFAIQKGVAYLFAYYDENNPTYVFRTTGYDPSSLSLVMPEEFRDNMWGRLEAYLRDGSYTAAEVERRQRLGLPQRDMTNSDALPPLDTGESLSGRVWPFAIAGIIALLASGCLCAGVWLRRKKAGTHPRT
ncbi:MAG: hypothetical protein IJC33_03605 [Clostridia bacterium]|nr:hypothetical protein [Clostridia bacterium]